MLTVTQQSLPVEKAPTSNGMSKLAQFKMAPAAPPIVEAAPPISEETPEVVESVVEAVVEAVEE